jgi:hypothetical protein
MGGDGVQLGGAFFRLLFCGVGDGSWGEPLLKWVELGQRGGIIKRGWIFRGGWKLNVLERNVSGNEMEGLAACEWYDH